MLEKLIKNSIDTDAHYNSLYHTAIKLFDNALTAAEYEEKQEQADMLRRAYKVVARQLQEALWCEWHLWLESHGCNLEEFHKALVNVLIEGMNQLYEVSIAA